MTNTKSKQQILEKVEAMEKELEELKKAAEKIDKEGNVWRPVIREDCFYIDDEMQVWEINRVEAGNYFRTREQAEKRAKYLGAVNRLMNAYEAIEQEIKWNDGLGSKVYNICFDQLEKKLDTDFNNLYSFNPFNFSDQYVRDQFVEDHKQDLLIYFGVE